MSGPEDARASAEAGILRREQALRAALGGVRRAETLTPREVARFRLLVLDYYRRCGRDLAWRHDSEPYRVLVSEVMLQQTQVPRVAVKYPSFVARFPDFGALAAAPLADVLDEWRGMGYNRRALQLRRAAETVVTRYGGALPADLDAIDALPGVGRATAAAVVSMAFSVPVPYIETNIRTVMLHFFFADAADVPDRDVLPMVARTLPPRDPRDWYYALMDYGTWLKKREPNPGRRSSHHVRQAPFGGSMRELRGTILRVVLDEEPRTAAAVARAAGAPEERVAQALAALVREGLLAEDGAGYRIA